MPALLRGFSRSEKHFLNEKKVSLLQKTDFSGLHHPAAGSGLVIWATLRRNLAGWMPASSEGSTHGRRH
jgi:hypothetical protein